MFWGVTLESGKHYSQKVSESYHLSMATLEVLEGDTKPVNRQVCVMLKHKEKEYALCVLEYGRVMQVNLDIIFDSGEVVTYFLKGEGTVHLTGYALAETDDASDSQDQTEEASGLALYDEEEEDDEDWTPNKDEEIISDEESEESEEGGSDTGSEPELISPKVVEINEDDDTDDAHDTKRENVKGSKSKKRKVNDSSLIQNGTAEGEKSNSKKQRKMDMNHVNAEDSDDIISTGEESEDGSNEDDDDSGDDYNSEEEQKISSAGRTPLPKNKVNSKTSLGESPELRQTPRNSAQKQQKTKNKGNVSSPNKGTVPVTLKNAKKLEGNVQIEDLRIGSGPTAKKGKLVYLHYVGQFTNGKVFESCEFPKKPYSFRLGKGEVIRGLEVGLQGMTVGGKRKITIPPNMGYGNQKRDNIPPSSTLMFTVELKAVNH